MKHFSIGMKQHQVTAIFNELTVSTISELPKAPLTVKIGAFSSLANRPHSQSHAGTRIRSTLMTKTGLRLHPVALAVQQALPAAPGRATMKPVKQPILDLLRPRLKVELIHNPVDLVGLMHQLGCQWNRSFGS